MEQKLTSPDKEFKTAHFLLIIVGFANLALSIMLYSLQQVVSLQFIIMLVFAIALIILSYLVRRQNIFALKVAILLWVAVIIEELIMLVILRNPIFLASILYKVAILVFLVAPLPSVRAEKEKVMNKMTTK